MIYTETTLSEHILVLTASAIQVALFSWFFLRWERRSTGEPGENRETEVTTTSKGYVARFTVLHVLTYLVIGTIFFELQDYDAAFAIQGQFELYRPLDDPIVALALPIQRWTPGPSDTPILFQEARTRMATVIRSVIRPHGAGLHEHGARFNRGPSPQKHQYPSISREHQRSQHRCWCSHGYYSNGNA